MLNRVLSLSLSHTYTHRFWDSYLYFVTRQWRNTAICALVNSVPTQNLIPPPKAMKCLVAPFNSTPCMPALFIQSRYKKFKHVICSSIKLGVNYFGSSQTYDSPPILMDQKQGDLCILQGSSVQLGDRP